MLSNLLRAAVLLACILACVTSTVDEGVVEVGPNGEMLSGSSRNSLSVEDGDANSRLFVPTIDLAPLLVGSRHPDYAPALAAMIEAASTLGFFHVTGHGVSNGLIRKNKEAMKEFFEMPVERKEASARNVGNSRGWSATELTKNKRDMKELFDYGMVVPPEGAVDEETKAVDPGFGTNQFPVHITRRGSLLVPPTVPLIFMNSCVELSHTLLNLLLTPFNITLPPDDNTIASPVHHTSYNRWNFYPSTDSVPFSEGTPLGISPHTDAGLLTVLYQDPARSAAPQLEVYTGSKEIFGDGEWIPVPPVTGDEQGFTINVGDMLQVLTSGYYKAPEHRVSRTAGPDTYSSALFYNPSYKAVIGPIAGSERVVLEGREGTGGVERYRDLEWASYRRRRWEGDYMDVGAEVQIEAYRV
jgi:isopenicillin N synthase-like dioxygenase